MDEGVLACLIDAALPWVCGRRVSVAGLDEQAAKALQRWSSSGAESSATVVCGSPPSEFEDILVLLMPGESSPPVISGLQAFYTRFAFRLSGESADDTAKPGLEPDAEWPYSRRAHGVWLDVEKPGEPLGVIAVYRRWSDA